MRHVFLAPAILTCIYLDEAVKVKHRENSDMESKGFCDAVTEALMRIDTDKRINAYLMSWLP